jgi:putative sigma-54 modulation protein
MQIDITARHVEITEAVKDHARKKLEKIASEFPHIEKVHVILAVEKYRNIAEMIVQAKKHLRLEALESSNDMYASIDAALGKIEKRLRKSVDKKHSHKSRVPVSEVVEKLEAEPDNA